MLLTSQINKTIDELNQSLDQQSLKLLGELLQETAQLEHCLLNTYLYAASLLKRTPQEFEQIDLAYYYINSKRVLFLNT